MCVCVCRESSRLLGRVEGDREGAAAAAGGGGAQQEHADQEHTRTICVRSGKHRSGCEGKLLGVCSLVRD